MRAISSRVKGVWKRQRERFRKKLGTIGLTTLSLGLVLSQIQGVAANPSGAQVRHGQVVVTPGVQTQIQQLTEKAIVDWNSFSIAPQEAVIFLQPGLRSVILNRVVGQDPSHILGRLQANGNVFLINRNGILFGPESVVNVGGLVASTLNLSDEDFLTGNYDFSQDVNSDLASLINQGEIRISDAGYAVLVAPTLVNEGTIVARAGNVLLGAGERATLNLDGRDLVHFAVDSQVSSGTILLAPGQLSDAVAGTLGVAANRRADQLIQEADGSVRLVNSSGTLVQAGTVSADGMTDVDAGSVTLDSSDLTILTEGSSTTASGQGQNSEGGRVLVLSEMDHTASLRGFTDLQKGSLVAADGGESGDGGFIEASGDGLNLHGEISLNAENGKAGSFLLDPVDVTIIDGDDAPTTVANPTIFNSTTNNTTTMIGDRWFNTLNFTDFEIQSSGDILFDQSIQGTNPAGDNAVDFSRLTGARINLTLTAGTDATEIGNIDLGNNGTAYTGLNDLTLQADGDVRFGDANLTVNDQMNVNSGNDILFQSSAVNTGDSVTLQATRNILFGDSNVDISGRGLSTLDSGNDIDFGNSRINQNVAPGQTSGFEINTGGDLNFSTTQIRVEGSDPSDLDIVATGSIDFGDATLSLIPTRPREVTIQSFQSIDLGTSDVLVDTNFGSQPIDLIISAVTGISSGAADGQAGTNTAKLEVHGDLSLTTTNGDLILNDVDVDVISDGLGGTANVILTANNGAINLGESRASFGEDVVATAGTNIELPNTVLDTAGRGANTFNAGGNLNFGSSLINQNVAAGQTSGFDITTGGNVDLGTSQIRVSGSDPSDFDINASGSISFGDSILNIVPTRPRELVIQSGQNIDLGTTDFLVDTDFGSQPLDLLLTAATGISSAAADGQAGTHTARIEVHGDLSLTTTDGDILLNDIELDTIFDGLGGAAMVTLTATNGAVSLGESHADFDENLNVTAGTDLSLPNTILDTAGRETNTFNVGRDLIFGNSQINQNVAAGQTSGFDITTGGDADFGDSNIRVSGSDPSDFDVNAAGSIRFGDATINLVPTRPREVEIQSGGSIDLGTIDLFVDTDFGTQPIDLLITAATGITSGAADGQPGTNSARIEVHGDLSFISASGDILLNDFDLDTISDGGGGTGDVIVRAPNGSINLGESNGRLQESLRMEAGNDVDLGNGEFSIIDTNEDVSFFAGGTLDASQVTINAPRRLTMGANGEVLADGSLISAQDIEIFGFDPLTLLLDPNRAVSGDVRLDLNTAGSLDISVLAQGDIELNHTGGGQLRLERAGVEGNGNAGSPSSIRSTNGSVSIVSDGDVRLGIGGGDAGDPHVQADSAGQVVAITADNIVDVTDNNGVDVLAGAQVELTGRNSVGQVGTLVEVQAPGVLIDVSQNAGSAAGVGIVGDSDFLKVLAQGSDIRVRELDNPSLGELRVQQAANNELTIDPLGIEGIHYVDRADVSVGPVSVSNQQTLVLQTIDGASILDGRTVGTNIDNQGSLILLSEGSIGETNQSILIPGGNVAAQAGNGAGNSVFLEASQNPVTVGSLQLVDPVGTIQAAADGISAGGDVVVKLTANTGQDLTQTANITSTNGGVLLEVAGGDLLQQSGVISGQSLGLSVSGNVGVFDGVNPDTVVNIATGDLALEVGGDAVLRQAAGDLNIVQQVGVAGETVTQTQVGGDLRVQTVNGELNVNTAVAAAADVALVSGASFVVNPQTTPGNINIDGDITGLQNVVLIAEGDITHTNGVVRAPNVGLGSGGSIGTTANPIQLEADNVAVSPANAVINDPNGFTTVNQVSAVGATVNQGNVPPPPQPPGGTVTVNVTLLPEAREVDDDGLRLPLEDADFEPFAQNNLELIENVLQDILRLNPAEQIELDPTRLPSGWFDDEDFLRRKFRR